jgi:hypothetical protein
MNKKQAQISIFIVLFVMLIVSFVFLISNSSEDKKKELEQSKAEVTSPSFNIELFKTQINFCLKKATIRASLFASYKGGYLYDKSKKSYEYFPGVYYEKFIPVSSLDLIDQNYADAMGLSNPRMIYSEPIFKYSLADLPEQAFVYPKEHDYYANFSGTMKYLQHGFKEDFDTFIYKEFLKCIDLKEFIDAGYSLDFTNVTSSFLSKDNSTDFYFFDSLAELGEEVYLVYNDKKYYGTINQTLPDNKVLVKFNEAIAEDNPDVLKEFTLLHPTKKIYVDTSFTDFTIDSKLSFPLISNTVGEKKTSLITSSVSLPVRFKLLISEMSNIINAKSLNRSLDLQDSNAISPVFSYPGDLIFLTNVIYEDDFKKQILFTIKDTKSKLSGNEVVFNGIYENTAPLLNLSECNKFNETTKECTLYLTENVPFSKDLSKNILSVETIDFNSIRFNSFNVNTGLSHLSLTSEGSLNVMLKASGTYSRDIIVSDGELSTTYTFYFTTGFPKNDNNKDAIRCIDIIPFTDDYVSSFFPIGGEFLDMGKMKLFDGLSEGGKKLPFTYVLHKPGDAFNGDSNFNERNSFLNYSLVFNEQCFIDPNLYEVKWSLLNEDEQVLNTLTDKLDLVPFNFLKESNFKDTILNEFNQGNPVILSAELYEKGGSQSLSLQPFQILLYPTGCLSPSTKDFIDSFEDGEGAFGGSLSCCDTQAIIEHSLKNEKPSVRGDLGNPLKSTGKAIDTDLYFSLPISTKGLAQIYDGTLYLNIFNYTQYSLWEEFDTLFGSEISPTSLFKTHITAICKGNYPRLEHNIDLISSTRGDLEANFDSLFLESNPTNDIVKYNDDTEISTITFDVVEQGVLCGFPAVSNETLYVNIKKNNKNITLIGGLQYYTDDSGETLFPVPSDDLLVLCDSTEYGGNDDGNHYFNWPLTTIGLTKNNTFKSKKYCSTDIISCNRPVYNRSIQTQFAQGGVCTKTQFDGLNLIQISESPSFGTGWYDITTTANCINTSNSAVVGSVLLQKQERCGDLDPTTIGYECTEYQLKPGETCPAGSTPQLPDHWGICQ